MKLRMMVVAAVVALTASIGAAPAFADPGQPKVTICHGSANHYVLITVDANALNGHFDGTDPGHGHRNLPDVFPAADGSCAGDGGGGNNGGGTL